MEPGQQGMLPQYPAESPGQLARVRKPERRRHWGWIAVGVVVALGKTVGLRAGWDLGDHHPHDFIFILPIFAALAVLRGKPVQMAMLLALAAAFAIDPASVPAGAGIAVVAFLVLLSVCLAIGTVLRWREKPYSSRR